LKIGRNEEAEVLLREVLEAHPEEVHDNGCHPLGKRRASDPLGSFDSAASKAAPLRVTDSGGLEQSTRSRRPETWRASGVEVVKHVR